MSRADLEKIYEYVDPAQFIERENWFPGLDMSERQIAAAAVITERAQTIVNTAAEELAGRLATLETRQHELHTELSVVSSEITLIQRAIGESSEKAVWMEQAERRRRQYASATTWDNVVKILQDEPSFILDIGELTASHYRFHWDNEFLRVAYHGEIKPFVLSRPAAVLSRMDRKDPAFYKNCEAMGLINILGEEDGEHLSANHIHKIQVCDPARFFDQAMDLTKFGLKSVIATLCIADMQAIAAAKQTSINNIM